MPRPPLIALLVLSPLWMVACSQQGVRDFGSGMSSLVTPPPPPSPDEVNAAYAAGDYESALRLGERLSKAKDDAPRETRDQAAYTAGLAAIRLEQPQKAQELLLRAAEGPDVAVRADALVALGRLYDANDEHALAAEAMLKAADLLQGDQRAQALLAAASSQQKLNRLPQGRTTLVRARGAATSPGLKRQIERQMLGTGYTIQVGAYTDEAEAQRAAEELIDPATAARLGPPKLSSVQDARTGQWLTLVQVGEFTTFASAQEAQRRLGAEGSMVAAMGE